MDLVSFAVYLLIIIVYSVIYYYVWTSSYNTGTKIGMSTLFLFSLMLSGFVGKSLIFTINKSLASKKNKSESERVLESELENSRRNSESWVSAYDISRTPPHAPGPSGSTPWV